MRSAWFCSKACLLGYSCRDAGCSVVRCRTLGRQAHSLFLPAEKPFTVCYAVRTQYLQTVEQGLLLSVARAVRCRATNRPCGVDSPPGDRLRAHWLVGSDAWP